MLVKQISSSIRSLKRQKFRTWFTVTSIAIGVTAIVLTTHIGFSGKAFLNKEMNSMGMDSLLLGTKEGSGTFYFAEDLNLIHKQNQVAAATPLLSSYAKVGNRGTGGSCGFLAADLRANVK